MQKALYFAAKIYILGKQKHLRCILPLDDRNPVSDGGIFLLLQKQHSAQIHQRPIIQFNKVEAVARKESIQCLLLL